MRRARTRVGAWRIVRGELDAYGASLTDKVEVVGPNKIDALEPAAVKEARDQAQPCVQGRGLSPVRASGESIEAVLDRLAAAIGVKATAPEEHPAEEKAMVPAIGRDAAQRLVVKVGSALLVDAEGNVRRAWLETLVADIAARMASGQQIAIVSSGAIALGARRLKLAKGGRASLEDAQAAAATGQGALSQCWAELLWRPRADSSANARNSG